MSINRVKTKTPAIKLQGFSICKGSKVGQMSNQKENDFTDNQLHINSEKFENDLEKIVRLGEYLKDVA